MLFLYLDESGNYTFSKNGSEYLFYTSLATANPYMIHHKLCELEKDFKKKNIPLQSGYFHASEDIQIVRDGVYKILGEIDSYDIDTIVVEKCKANPAIRDIVELYKKIYGILLRYVFNRYNATKILIYLHEAPIQKRRHAIEKGIKETLSEILDIKQVKYHISFLPSVFSYGLQAVDYCCWAFKKKWGEWGEKIDLRPYDTIKQNRKSEFNIFASGNGYKYY